MVGSIHAPGDCSPHRSRGILGVLLKGPESPIQGRHEREKSLDRRWGRNLVMGACARRRHGAQSCLRIKMLLGPGRNGIPVNLPFPIAAFAHLTLDNSLRPYRLTSPGFRHDSRQRILDRSVYTDDSSRFASCRDDVANF
jgi:hypothetical protein